MQKFTCFFLFVLISTSLKKKKKKAHKPLKDEITQKQETNYLYVRQRQAGLKGRNKGR